MLWKWQWNQGRWVKVLSCQNLLLRSAQYGQTNPEQQSTSSSPGPKPPPPPPPPPKRSAPTTGEWLGREKQQVVQRSGTLRSALMAQMSNSYPVSTNATSMAESTSTMEQLNLLHLLYNHWQYLHHRKVRLSRSWRYQHLPVTQQSHRLLLPNQWLLLHSL